MLDYLADMGERAAMHRAKVCQYLFVILLIVTLILALWPVKIAPSYISGGLPHGLAFGLLASLAFFAFPRLGIALLWGGLVLFGAAIEALQWAMPFGRAAQWSDFLLDSIVASIALLVLSVVRIMAGWFRQRSDSE